MATPPLSIRSANQCRCTGQRRYHRVYCVRRSTKIVVRQRTFASFVGHGGRVDTPRARVNETDAGRFRGRSARDYRRGPRLRPPSALGAHRRGTAVVLRARSVCRAVLPPGARVSARRERAALGMPGHAGADRAGGEPLRGGDGSHFRLQRVAPGALHPLRRERRCPSTGDGGRRGRCRPPSRSSAGSRSPPGGARSSPPTSCGATITRSGSPCARTSRRSRPAS